MEKVQNFIFPNAAPQDGVSWWMKYAGKAGGIIGGIVAMLFGVLCAMSILNPWCIVAGIWQFTAGFIIIVIEAPFCCMCLDFVKSFSELVDSRPPWQKTALYIVLALPPLVLCMGFSTLIGSGMLVGTAILYGMQTVGKKASNADMAAAARGDTEPDEKNIMDDGDWQTNP